MKRIFLSLTIFLLSCSGLFFSRLALATNPPVNPYGIYWPYAAVPGGIGAGGAMGPAAAGTAMSIPGAVVGGISIFTGMYVGYVAFCPILNGVSQTNVCTQVAMGANTNTKPRGPQNIPATDGVSTPVTMYCFGSGTVPAGCVSAPFNTCCLAADVAGYCSAIGGSYSSGTSTCNSVPGHGSLAVLGYASTTQCPAGYAVPGGGPGTCALSDPYAAAAAASYAYRDYLKSGASYAVKYNPTLGSNPYLGDAVMTVASSNDTVTVGGTTKTGQPQTTQVTSGGAGGGSGANSACMLNTISNGDGTVTKTQVCVDANGYVTSTITWTEAGGVTVTPASGVVPVGGSGSGVGVSGVTGVSGVGSTLSNNLLGQIASSTASTAQPCAVSGACQAGNVTGTKFGSASSVQSAYNAIMSSVTAVSGATASDASTFTHTFEAWMFPDTSTAMCTDIYGGSGVPPSLSAGGFSYQLPDICANPNIARARDLLDYIIMLWTAFELFTSFYKPREVE